VTKFQATNDDADDVREIFEKRKLSHLRVRRRGDYLIVESGDQADPVRHARFHHVTQGLWMLDAATHTGQWEPTMQRAPLLKLVETLIAEYSWLISEHG
jgi:hypothetical protein